MTITNFKNLLKLDQFRPKFILLFENVKHVQEVEIVEADSEIRSLLKSFSTPLIDVPACLL